MKEKKLDHPELITGPNPLLEVLAPFIPLKSMPAALRREPLDDIDWRSLPPEQRESLLVLLDEHYWPVEPQVRVAFEIQLMLRSGLVLRNPMSRDEQRRINMLALADCVDKVQYQSLRRRAGGAILAAVTGMGKSTLMERVLSVVAPQQVVVHRENKECGWSVLTQVVYLIVNAPSNATRRGLFAAIIGALDTLLATNYLADLKRQKNLDEAMVFVAKVLSFHRVGLLVIDENQASTLAEHVWGEEFIQYFLGLMNLGIPVLLVGNPLAFSELASNAQLRRRFVAHGWHDLEPAPKENKDSWWTKEFLYGATRFVVCEEVPSVEDIQEVTSDIDGGIPAIFLAIWKEGQKIALRRQGKKACLTVKDLKSAALSPNVEKLLAIAHAVSSGNADAQFVDLPRRSKVQDQGAAERVEKEDVAGGGEALSRISRHLRRQESRQKMKKERNKAIRETLTEDDLRRGADALAVLAGMPDDQGELDV